MIKEKILEVMDDRFLDAEYIAFKAGISNHTAMLALTNMINDFIVVKHMGRFKLVSCPGDLEIALTGQTDIVM